MSDFGLFLQFCLVISVSTMCEAVAKHDFNGQDESELSFKKSNIMKILGTSEHEGWYNAEMDGREGVIPATYVQLKPNDFMVPKVTRHGAEERLLMEHDGAFLIRESENTPGDFSLSVKFGDGVQHFKVLRDGAGKYFLWVVKFNSLNALVEYHRTSSVSRSQQIFLRDRKPAVIHVALYNFTAEEEGELSLKKGDKIEVINDADPNWWTGRLVATGVGGMFPRTYIKEITE